MPSCGAESPSLYQVKKGKKEGLRGPSLSPGPSYKAAQATDRPAGAVRCTHRAFDRLNPPRGRKAVLPTEQREGPWLIDYTAHLMGRHLESVRRAPDFR